MASKSVMALTGEDRRSAPPLPQDVSAFLPWICNQLQAPFIIRVEYAVHEDRRMEERSKSAKSKLKITSQHTSKTSEVADSGDSAVHSTADTIVITAYQDAYSTLIELNITRCRSIPRMLFKILALIAPYHPSLQKLTIRWSPLDGDVIYEIAKFLTPSTISEICLDDSPSLAANYPMLLDTCQLKSLSLARCKIGDGVCVTLASKLTYPQPACKSLAVLNLTSNNITDLGAQALGEMLRSNRHLRYLNLSGNFVTDSGAVHILNSLMEFPLSYEEIINKRLHRLQYLKSWEELYSKCLEELMIVIAEKAALFKRKSMRVRKISNTSFGAGLDNPELKAEIMVNEQMGQYDGPYIIQETVARDGYVHSIGNLALCYLNLAFNSLEFGTLVKLQEVLLYQHTLGHSTQSGLLKVVLEGNNLPNTCKELEVARELLDKVVDKYVKAYGKKEKPKGKK